jgi:exodeoxyribonuclease VII large subunit
MGAFTLQQTPLKLSELTGMVADSLNRELGNRTFPLLAEIADLRNYSDRRYCFFKLIEKLDGEIIASADAVIWRNEYPVLQHFERQTGKVFAGNIQLLLTVGVAYSPRWGLRFQVFDIDTAYTLGNMEADRQAVLTQLVTQHADLVRMVDGEYISANASLQLPPLVQRIALITAPDSDGQRDFMHEISFDISGMDFNIVLFPSQVQGAGASEQLTARLHEINHQAELFDAVVIVRGGGSSTDLSVFDDAKLALAIAACTVPVLTGIGHERNVSIADLMAHTRYKTPTKVAAGLVEHNAGFVYRVSEVFLNILRLASNRLQQETQIVKSLWSNLLLQAGWRAEREMHRIENMGQQIARFDPANILRQGFARIYQNGKPLRSGKELQTGENLLVEMQDAIVEVTITSKKDKHVGNGKL